MRIRDLFLADVTRDIPPVVYFHEQSQEKLRSEVSEYIITGGYPQDDLRARRVPSGIHEQFVQLLRAIRTELDKAGGPELPASWISGFYGSGKSSFAKLLGLALDGATLPDGTPLEQALLARDDSPRAPELRAAWTALRQRIDPIAVVFDIGGVARDNEHIHAAVVRQLQVRLEYCSTSHLVADYELILEREGEWGRFQALCERTLGKPWKDLRTSNMAEDHFSHVMHVMFPDRYAEPTTWIESRAGRRSDLSVTDATKLIEAMLSIRAPGKSLFLVVDEVSQYVHQEPDRMLRLQNFVSDLGQRLKGAVWLFATGQEKLEETTSTSPIGKLKDRFPPALRVHLSASNVRDVVHRRLLKKDPNQEALLRDLFQRHRPDLKLHGYRCEEITEEDFVEIYPMLPEQIDLLLAITSALRTRSTRIKSDDHTIRGLLQLLGELFREKRLADGEIGELVTLDAIYDVQRSALDSDVQTTMARIATHPDVSGDALCQRAAKAVALLELTQDQVPTHAPLIASCLYSHLGQGNNVPQVTAALERLRAANLLGYSEKQGYKIQSSAGQEWQRDREALHFTQEKVSEVVREALRWLFKEPERPKLRGRSFPLLAYYSDGRSLSDARVAESREDACVVFDFRYLIKAERDPAIWVRRSAEEVLHDRVIWLVGEPGPVDELARELLRSKGMVDRHGARRESLTRDKQRLLLEEEVRSEELVTQVQEAVAQAFFGGTLFFRGQTLLPRDLGGAFSTALAGAGARVLPALYPHYVDVAVSPTELLQLLEPERGGPSSKFLDLGILSLDAGRCVPTCAGPVPARVLQHIETEKGTSGASLLQRFGRPPYGYGPDVVKACLVGLLRASKIRIRPEAGHEITSLKDPGAQDLFRHDRELRRADIFPATDALVTARDRVAICGFFKKYLDLDLDRENDAIADAVYERFPAYAARLREVEALLRQIPAAPELPAALQRLGKALEECRRSRHVEEIVAAVKRHLDALRDGFEQLLIYQTDLSEAAIQAVREAAQVQDHQLAQMEAAGAAFSGQDAAALREHLRRERPWRDIGALTPAVARLRAAYTEARRATLGQQARQADDERERIKILPGFERLDATEAHHVLRPLAEALWNTTADALAPPLLDLRDRFPERLARAVEEAEERLDQAQPRDVHPVVKVKLPVHGREIQTREQLKAVLKEVEERILPYLDGKTRVRVL